MVELCRRGSAHRNQSQKAFSHVTSPDKGERTDVRGAQTRVPAFSLWSAACLGQAVPRDPRSLHSRGHSRRVPGVC